MKTNVTLSLNTEEIEAGKKQAKDKGLSFSSYIGQLIREKDDK